MTRDAETVVPLAPPKLEVTYFVVQRSTGEWSPASKIVQTFTQQPLAELAAVQLKRQFPHQHFAVAALCCEARHSQTPIEIVRV